MTKRIFIGLLILSFLAVTMGCAEWNRTAKGAAIGAGAGGAAGGLIGHAAGNTVAGVLIGAAVGGAAGALIGNYMDKQAAEIERDIEGAKVERVGEGIKITFSSGILFDIDKADLKDYSRAELAKLAAILNKYDDTNILLAGHTDSTGSDEYNLKLSRRRAEAVSGYLSAQNVNAERFTINGYGKTDPIASNDTADGRTQNRRVEVAIWANEKLKKVAQEKTI
ncbi:MAG: OmpA family protein [Desulfobacterales bacterium]|jgi:outer membrane protein OmpA-like peptidoglycan-associated protein|nr:OmpA family protein [Desulfobacterales bacterium]